MEQYYVYQHTDPNSGELVYIGHGKGSRAWHFGSTNRGEDHFFWAQLLFEQGFLPTDFTTILARGLTKEDACFMEQEEIRISSPTFNLAMGLKLLKLSKGQVLVAQGYRKKGWAYHRIAALFNVSTMTMYRALTGGNKNAPQ